VVAQEGFERRLVPPAEETIEDVLVGDALIRGSMEIR
jgi:hypothetical protein